MKYVVVIIDGAADRPLKQHDGKTPLELAHIPNLNRLAREGTVGLTNNVPEGMEPSSAVACMSVMGYDPIKYYRGRSAIEAKSIGVPVGENDVVFRCNLVAIRHECMWSYSAGYISTDEARQLIQSLNEKLGNEKVRFFPGVGYRHILRLTDAPETLQAKCTPPHDIAEKPIAPYLPSGPGSGILIDLMRRSREVLEKHPVNLRRIVTGGIPAHQIWLFWGSGKIPEMPSFKDEYRLAAALTSGVDLLKGLAKMTGMEVLDIPGVTDGLDNDFEGQIKGAVESLKHNDMVIIHIEAPDEASHDGSIEKKVEALEKIDKSVLGYILNLNNYRLNILVLPDHPTPIEIKTHSAEPVPFVCWGQEFHSNGARLFSEMEAKRTGLIINPGCNLMRLFLNIK